MRYATNDASNRNGALRSSPLKQLFENGDDRDIGGNRSDGRTGIENYECTDRSYGDGSSEEQLHESKPEPYRRNACHERSRRDEGFGTYGKAVTAKIFAKRIDRSCNADDESDGREPAGKERRAQKHRDSYSHRYAGSRCRRR